MKNIINFICFLRKKLPVPMFDRSQVSLWSIAKHLIGKVKMVKLIFNFIKPI